MNENELITKEEIRGKVEHLIADGETRKRALALKEMATRTVVHKRASFENFNTLFTTMKDDVWWLVNWYFLVLFMDPMIVRKH